MTTAAAELDQRRWSTVAIRLVIATMVYLMVPWLAREGIEGVRGDDYE